MEDRLNLKFRINVLWWLQSSCQNNFIVCSRFTLHLNTQCLNRSGSCSTFPFFGYAMLSVTQLMHTIWSQTTGQEWNQSGIVPKLKTHASCSLPAECGVSLFCVVESAVGLCTGGHRCHTRGQIVMIAYGAEQQKTFTTHRDENVSKQLRASKRKREEEYQHLTMKQSGIHFSSATYTLMYSHQQLSVYSEIQRFTN